MNYSIQKQNVSLEKIWSPTKSMGCAEMLPRELEETQSDGKLNCVIPSWCSPKAPLWHLRQFPLCCFSVHLSVVITRDSVILYTMPRFSHSQPPNGQITQELLHTLHDSATDISVQEREDGVGQTHRLVAECLNNGQNRRQIWDTGWAETVWEQVTGIYVSNACSEEFHQQWCPELIVSSWKTNLRTCSIHHKAELSGL